MTSLVEKYQEMTVALNSDHKYNAIDDNYDRAFYLVNRRASRLAKFGRSVLKKCAKHEQEHCKSPAKADHYLTQSFILTQHAKKRELTEREWHSIVDNWNQALRLLPMNWNDWPTMRVFLELYCTRAKFAFEREDYQHARQCLRHASSVLIYFNCPEVMIDHFEDDDSDLLILMISLKTELLVHLKESDESNSDTSSNILFDAGDGATKGIRIESREDVKEALETLHKIDAKLDAHYKTNFASSPDAKLNGQNFVLTKKVKMNSTEHGGRSFLATEPIAAGETILYEKAQVTMVFYKHLRTHCNYCYRSVTVFWPCAQCTELVFCSAKCSMQAYKEYHRFECGILGLALDQQDYYSVVHAFRLYNIFGLKTALECEDEEMNANKGYAKPFDVNLYLTSEAMRLVPYNKQSPEEQKLLCRALFSLVSHRGERQPLREHIHTIQAVAVVYFYIYKGILCETVLQDPMLYSRLLEHLATGMHRICTNGFAWSTEISPGEENYEEDSESGCDVTKLASCVCLASSFINHSCCPNVEWDIGGKGVIHLTAKRGIASGEWLTTCYGPKRGNPFWERQSRLFYDYCFLCRCEVCMVDVASSEDTLLCQRPGGECNGPLVRREYNACLLCGYRVPEHDLHRLKMMHRRAMHASKAFARTFVKLTKEAISLRSCLHFSSSPKVKKEQFVCLLDDETSQRLLDILVSAAMFEKHVHLYPGRITKSILQSLEKHLKQLKNVSFAGSYQLLSECVLLLQLYHRIEDYEKSLDVLAIVFQALEYIYPEMTDWSLVTLIYELEFAAAFCEKIAVKFGLDKPPQVNRDAESDEQDYVSNQQDLVEHIQFWAQVSALNTKLVDILQYDKLHRGDFFPCQYSKLKLEDVEGEVSSGEANADERYFASVYGNAQRRLLNIEKLTNQVSPLKAH